MKPSRAGLCGTRGCRRSDSHTHASGRAGGGPRGRPNPNFFCRNVSSECFSKSGNRSAVTCLFLMTTNTPYQAGSERRGRSAQPPQGGAREPRGEDGLPQSHLLRPAPGGDWRGVPSASTAVRTRQPLGLSEHLPPTPRVPSKALRGSCPLGPWRACFLQEAERRTCWSSVLGP